MLIMEKLQVLEKGLLRRFGGRQIGKGMRVIPSGDTYFGNAIARSFRSVVGANATIS